jgi:murein DD-endopeptidase MepM/ murein hydrolase activator NlpD
MKAIQQFLAAIDAHLSLDEVHQGDVFDMVVDYKRAPDGQVEVGDLQYAAIEQGGHMAKQLLRWGKGRDMQFYDASDMAAQRETQALIMPVAGARISSGFGLRLHPVLGFARMHSGTDLAAPWGAPVMPWPMRWSISSGRMAGMAITSDWTMAARYRPAMAISAALPSHRACGCGQDR